MLNIIPFILENKQTIIILAAGIGRVYYALKNGGGLVGIWNSLIFGKTSVKKIGDDNLKG